MIICSCAVISDRDIETAVLEIMSADNAPLPTPGIVYRHLCKKMECCGCAPLAVAAIYEAMERLEAAGRICPCACNTARSRLNVIQLKTSSSAARNGNPSPVVVEAAE